MKLSERLEACAEEVSSFPHPSACDHLHDAAGLLREAAALARRYEEAATGECVEAGSIPGLEGDPFVGVVIESTPDELKLGPPIVYQRVKIVRIVEE